MVVVDLIMLQQFARITFDLLLLSPIKPANGDLPHMTLQYSPIIVLWFERSVHD